MRPKHRRRAASRKTRAAVPRIRATTPASHGSRFHARSSKAVRTCARRTTAAVTARPRATRSRSIL